MFQANLNIQMDAALSKQFAELCDEIGMSVDTAISVFAKRAVRKWGFPFEVTGDPFYSESNMNELRRRIAEMDAGKGVEHELIEVDD